MFYISGGFYVNPEKAKQHKRLSLLPNHYDVETKVLLFTS